MKGSLPERFQSWSSGRRKLSEDRGYHKPGSEDRRLPGGSAHLPSAFLHGLNLDRFGLSLYWLFAEVRHHLFCHHSLIL